MGGWGTQGLVKGLTPATGCDIMVGSHGWAWAASVRCQGVRQFPRPIWLTEMETEMRKGNRGRTYSLFEKQDGKWVRLTPNAYYLATARNVWQMALLAAALSGTKVRSLRPAVRVEICGPVQR